MFSRLMSDTDLCPLLLDLTARGLLHQATDLAGLNAHLATSRKVYGGFDPTKDSLTIGNLVLVMLLRRFQDAGHEPVVIMGGGTGLIGDPSGKDAERQLLGTEQIEANVRGQQPIFEALLDFAGENKAVLVNNADWLPQLSFVEVLRDVGKHFSINMMIQKESVKKRLETREHGITYTEFSYMILQAYDFCRLRKDRGVTVQLGGSDQWGNIVAGIDLTRRVLSEEVFGLTTPLLTKADGSKFGKSESGAVFLTTKYTSAYAFYQFFINSADQDIEKLFLFLSLRPISEIQELLAAHQQEPGKRLAQAALAEELTELLHGAAALAEAKAATQALFSGAVSGLSADLLDEAFSGAPTSHHELSVLEGDGLSVVEALVLTGVTKSKREARQFLASGAVSVNGERAAEELSLTTAHLLHGRVVLLRRGKKTWHVCRFS